MQPRVPLQYDLIKIANVYYESNFYNVSSNGQITKGSVHLFQIRTFPYT